MNSDPIDALLRLFAQRGQERYGEHVTQAEHALQCATLAEGENAPPSLIVAALLHDVGHLLHRDFAARESGCDDRHERLGAKHLARWFGQAVVRPIALHVAAKRYLCLVKPSYATALSPVSRRTLALQGGPMGATEAALFESDPFAQAAIRVRRWDDGGKRAGVATPSFDHFRPAIAACRIA